MHLKQIVIKNLIRTSCRKTNHSQSCPVLLEPISLMVHAGFTTKDLTSPERLLHGGICPGMSCLRPEPLSHPGVRFGNPGRLGFAEPLAKHFNRSAVRYAVGDFVSTC